MRPTDRPRAQRIDDALQAYSAQRRALPGIATPARRGAFLEQLVESIRRIEYVTLICKRKVSVLRADPLSDLFDPLKAAILQKQRANFDEGFWLVFLSVHCGRHGRDGWRLSRDIYAGAGPSATWDWMRTRLDPQGFREWLAAQTLTWNRHGVARHFGNHRKYQSLDAWTKTGTGAAVESYVKWVAPFQSHRGLLQDAQLRVGTEPRAVFDYLFHSMDAVISFGRTAKFDYLTMLGKLGLAAIEPGSVYLNGATGPLSGARLLFADDVHAKLRTSSMEQWLVELGDALVVGMQVLEDALCNWQKSPTSFKPFRG